MTLLVCWLIFPLLLLGLGWGAGGLLVSGGRRPIAGPLRISLGLALIIAVGNFLLAVGPLVGLVIPVALVLAVAGGLVARGPWPPDRWAVGAGAIAFAVSAAPIVLSGHATFAGYIKLDDTSTWLDLMDRAMEHGRSAAGLAPSSFRSTFEAWATGSAYPFGWFIPLGVLRPLLGQDGLWLFAPFLATLTGLLAAVLADLGRGLLSRGALRLAAGAAGGGSSLLLGYALWGGIKEVVAAWGIVTVGAAVSGLPRRERDPRSVLSTAVALAALIAVLSAGAGAWEAPLAVGLLVVVVLGGPLRRPWAAAPLRAFALLAVGALLALPVLVVLHTFVRVAGGLTQGGSGQNDIGNLIHPLYLSQVAGVWLGGDFRVEPSTPLNGIMVAVVVVGAVLGATAAARRGQWGVVAYPAIALAGLAVTERVGGAWLVGKALAIASPALPFLAMAGAGVLVEAGGRRRWLGVSLAAVLGMGLLASDLLAYHDTFLAPRDRLAELEHVGTLVGGHGPTLITEIEVYGSRHLLRAGDPTGAADLRPYFIPLTGGGDLIKDGYADLDAFELSGIQGFRSLVIRRSPTESRPPSIFRRVWEGRYYELWQRPPSSGERLVAHLSLGDLAQRPYCGSAQQGGQTVSRGSCSTQAAAVPACPRVAQLSAVAQGAGGHLVAFAQPRAVVVAPGSLGLPVGWLSYPGAELVAPTGPGTAAGSVTLPAGGRWEVWLGGSFNRRVDVSVDGRPVGSVSDELANRGQYLSLGTRPLAAGPHTVAITAHGGSLAPGSGYLAQTVGDLILKAPTDLAGPLISVPARRWRSLCGHSLDWIEVVAP